MKALRLLVLSAVAGIALLVSAPKALVMTTR